VCVCKTWIHIIFILLRLFSYYLISRVEVIFISMVNHFLSRLFRNGETLLFCSILLRRVIIFTVALGGY